MQRNDINGVTISRLGLGTKRFPTEDSARVIHLDTKAAEAIVAACLEGGIDFFDTSYSNHKGEAETFLGEQLSQVETPTYVATSFFEMVDPRYEYVFQKQLKKLERTTIDFYTVEGVTDLNQEINVDSGAIDYLFAQKEAGAIGQLGFCSELSADKLEAFIGRYPWDFVRLRINFYDWFERGVRERYEVAAAAGLPIIAHGALRTGPATRLKEEPLRILKEADPARSSVDWALRFVKSLPEVRTVSCNVHSVSQMQQNMEVFSDGEVLDSTALDALRMAAEAQRAQKASR